MGKKKGFTLLEILVVVIIIALLTAIMVPNLLRARLLANQSNAQAALKSISIAVENYAATNHNLYPNSTTDLLSTPNPYLANDYFTGEHNGYTFNIILDDFSYTATANPINANTGTFTYTISTGGIMETVTE